MGARPTPFSGQVVRMHSYYATGIHASCTLYILPICAKQMYLMSYTILLSGVSMSNLTHYTMRA